MTININASTVDVGSDLPDLLYATDSVPKFRVFQTLGTGGFAKAVLARSSMEPSRVFCLKVFRKDQPKDIEEIMMDLAVNKRIATLLPCPARNFLMGLEFSFQTKHEIIFAMVCPFPLRSISVV
ncbi:hypothetical protein CY34DRAFT_728421 [Suillus luteus UH-Slu-Lm8-n1]|uniref:Protein kinase domain-containing protein n=1 Tax=Suillus luteus UH-Slu-Lm8-n1 TaxID=930992 RepID=A0A0D0B9W6_9AGAM|nr:hypothetical protein CY34DRAFT_728421 [Suillus luteus UH-Slu-Lm8-n1]